MLLYRSMRPRQVTCQHLLALRVPFLSLTERTLGHQMPLCSVIHDDPETQQFCNTQDDHVDSKRAKRLRNEQVHLWGEGCTPPRLTALEVPLSIKLLICS